MKNPCFAAIDIGSNAVRLVVKRIETDPTDNTESLSQDLLIRFPLRLGEDAFLRQNISKEKTKELLLLVKAFRNMLKIFHIVELKAYATSAMRDAENGKEVVKKIFDKTGVNIEIITGEKEARIVYETQF